MTRTLAAIGWTFVVVDLGLAALLATSRGGDAATRGLGPGLGSALAALAAAAAGREDTTFLSGKTSYRDAVLTVKPKPTPATPQRERRAGT